MKEIPLGALAPLELEVLIKTADPALDLTTVSAVQFSVFRDYDQQTAIWNGTASAPSATTTSLTVSHTFAAGDVPCLGPYAVTPILTVPGGSVPCTAVDVFAVPLSRYEPEVPGQLPTPSVSYAQIGIGGQPT